MKPILNIAAYLFVSLDELIELRAKMLDECHCRHIKGTILLTGEGINLFLAGEEIELRGFIDWLRRDSRFHALVTKDSWSETQPFQKMLIKLKNEIIRMNHPMIRPEQGRANFISPKKLQEWLDRGTDDLGRPVVMLDTRNAFEVDYGTFNHALHFNINKFTEFPQAITAHKEALMDKTIVSFCTGGIRCEKSGLYMREIGMEHSYQLEGGILKYFEEVGSAHYTGTCFVFDEREALESNLDSIPEEHSIRQKIKSCDRVRT
ncbi:sulfurtransferase [Polynucleobacter antarcticus]|uniref:tRNA uridine(34) hydroxylase n=1 Tax=Polynucleobacter antarcticus TaxID=1743162 RepID=A0A6M9Q108_9BURK|nr:sulfurtransferase [Polynucleobacter antarcticus]QKM63696.1 sulfurtransferase [Polynucleobacter antarcticus]